MSVNKSFFGTYEGKNVDLYKITAANGAYAEIITYGGTLHTLFVPDRDGKLTDVLIGFDDIKGHVERSDYQGQLVGRYANRIAGGKFSVNGKVYEITKNEEDKNGNPITCLHGGGEFSHSIWDAEIAGENSVLLSYTSPDGANGFPGEMTAKVKYTFNDDNELIMEYSAVCTQDSPINLTNHAYFNLGSCENVLNTELYINADSFTPTDENSIPTSEIRKVSGTAFDFTSPKAIGRDIGQDDIQLVMCKGYDHNFCLNEHKENEVCASAYAPETGIFMEMFTSLPGVQLYTGNFLSSVEGKGGKPMNKHAGFCLETQSWPDTPNQPAFPSCTYKAGEEYRSVTSGKFSVK